MEKFAPIVKEIKQVITACVEREVFFAHFLFSFLISNWQMRFEKQVALRKIIENHMLELLFPFHFTVM